MPLSWELLTSLSTYILPLFSEDNSYTHTKAIGKGYDSVYSNKLFMFLDRRHKYNHVIQGLQTGFRVVTQFLGTLIRHSWLHFLTHYPTQTSVLSHSLHCRCLVATCNDANSPFSGFPNCPQPQLSQLCLPTDSVWSSSLLPATSRHAHSWHRAPLGPMAIYLFNFKTFVFFLLRWTSLSIQGGVGLFSNWCPLTTP
jgi:hypothetical protein